MRLLQISIQRIRKRYSSNTVPWEGFLAMQDIMVVKIIAVVVKILSLIIVHQLVVIVSSVWAPTREIGAHIDVVAGPKRPIGAGRLRLSPI